jgi:ABC-type transport system involved in cytochrome bd biosynthesis fused ATPase/permease subunit
MVIKVSLHRELYSRKVLDFQLSRALDVELENGRLTAIDESEYVLTLDYTLKMLNIHERYMCGVPVIIEGETGVGKTALVEMLSKLWNQSLLLEWKKQRSRLLDFFRNEISVAPGDSKPHDYEVSLVMVP